MVNRALIAGALLLALVAACPAALALAADEGGAPQPHASFMGVAGAVLTADSSQDAEKEEQKLPAALKGETSIEKRTIAYDESLESVKEAEELAARLQLQINELEKLLPEQEARSNAGIKQRYIMQSNPLAIAEPLLAAESLDEFIRQFDYLQLISRSNLKEFNKTRAMRADLKQAEEEHALVLETTQAKAEEARLALEQVQDERAEKQKDGQEESVSQAGTESDKSSEEEDEEEADEEEADEEDEEDDDEEADEDEDEDEEEEEQEAVTRDTDSLIDGADWHAHRDEFIAEWAERLDNYLAGSPLEGQGVNFAASAWKYCIDPRWSAAISNTESSKGAFCIRPHNAWGWGAADSDPYNLASEWDSWEEAIDAHAAGLAKGYGYTISMRGAQSYCPPTWPSWYNRTLGEMAKI